MSDASKLLNRLHTGGSFGFFWTKPGKRSHWFECGDSAAPREIKRDNEVYFGIHPVAECGQSNTRSSNETIECVNALYADIDAKSFGGDIELARSAVDGLVPAPSAVVASGGGFHCYWFSDKTRKLKTPKIRDRISRLQKHWVAFVKGDPGVNDLARILRVPGTYNHKYTPPRLVELIEFHDIEYAWDELEEICAFVTHEDQEPETKTLVKQEQNDEVARHDTLLHVALTLRKQGVSDGEILKTLKLMRDQILPEKDRDISTVELGSIIEWASEKAHPEGFELTELGNALRLIARAGDQFRFIHRRRAWYGWTGKVWQENAKPMLMRELHDMAVDIRMEAASVKGDSEAVVARRKALWKHAQKSEGSYTMEAAAQIASYRLELKHDEIDTYPMLLNLQNGILDLETMKLRDHDPNLYLTRIMPVAYDPQAKCPEWRKRLLEWADDKPGEETNEIAAFLQRFAGYALTGLLTDPVIPFLWGEGRNGKSTFNNTLLELWGIQHGYGWKVEAEHLIVGRSEKFTHELFALIGKRLAISSDIPDGATLAGSRLKNISGEFIQTATAKYKMPENYIATVKLIMQGNHKPTVEDDSLGMWSRLAVVPFTRTFEGEKAIAPDVLHGMFMQEGPGILNWALEEMKTGSIERPGAITKATEEYRTDQDRFRQFLDERTIREFEKTADKELMLAELHAWAKKRKDHELAGWTPAKLTQRLKKSGVVADRAIYHGIGLLAQPNLSVKEPDSARLQD